MEEEEEEEESSWRMSRLFMGRRFVYAALPVWGPLITEVFLFSSSSLLFTVLF
jgi:hypothetical protein